MNNSQAYSPFAIPLDIMVKTEKECGAWKITGHDKHGNELQEPCEVLGRMWSCTGEFSLYKVRVTQPGIYRFQGKPVGILGEETMGYYQISSEGKIKSYFPQPSVQVNHQGSGAGRECSPSNILPQPHKTTFQEQSRELS